MYIRTYVGVLRARAHRITAITLFLRNLTYKNCYNWNAFRVVSRSQTLAGESLATRDNSFLALTSIEHEGRSEQHVSTDGRRLALEGLFPSTPHL